MGHVGLLDQFMFMSNKTLVTFKSQNFFFLFLLQ